MQVPRVPSQPRSVPSKAMETLFSPAKHARVAALQPKRFVSARRAAVRKLKRFVWRLVSCSDLDAPIDDVTLCLRHDIGVDATALAGFAARICDILRDIVIPRRGYAPVDHAGVDFLRNTSENTRQPGG